MKIHSIKKAIAFFALFVLASSTSFSQGIIPTVGKDFWLTYTENYDQAPLMELFITSDQNTTGTVEIPLQGWSVNYVVIANETTTVTIPNALVDAENAGSNIISNKGIHVTSELDVSVFAINFIEYTSDASKILPTKSLGTEYTVVSYAGIAGNYSEIAIVATQDDTEIEITPSENVSGGVSAGTTYTILLNEGETYQIQCTSENNDFTGTHIVATDESGNCRPFAVFSGSECANIPIGCTFCDMVFDQNFPSDSWGTEYLIAPFDFSSSYTYKVVAIHDNTQVFENGALINTINAGESIEVNNEEDAVFISSNNAINVTQFMQGVSCSVIGDPAMLILNANDQQINHITFSTVTSTVITQHVVNIITESNYIDQVFLDGTPIPPSDFTVFPGLPSYSFAQIPLAEGSHVLDSPEGFSAYVYGIGEAESYAYSVGSYSLEDPIEIYSVDCSGNQIVLSPDEPLYDVWWSTEDEPLDTILAGEDLVIVPPIVTQAYILHGISQLSNCPLEFIYSVESPEDINVSIIPDSLELCFHESHTFQPVTTPPSPNYVYTWSTGYAFENPNEMNGIIQPEISGWYYLEVTTLSECGFGQDSVYIEVIGGAISDFTVSAFPEAICLPDSSELSVNIQEIILIDNFDSGINLTQWTTINGGTNSQDCGSLSEDALYFNQAAPRNAETIDLDVSSGGVVNFAIKIANGVSPCDNTELGEDVILEFSTNGGGSWTDIIILYEMLYADFTMMSVDIPVAAQTNATRFRWRQTSTSGVGEDNWCLDNVSISTTMTSPPNILWTSALDQPISNTTNISTFSTLTESNYFYCEMSIDGCDYIDSIFVSASNGVQALLHDTTFCVTLGSQITYPIDDPALYSFNWNNNPAIDNPFIAFPTITEVDFSGDLIVQITSILNQCELIDTVSVDFGELDINDLQNSTICIGENLIYTYDNQDLFFTWLPNPTLTENSDTELFLEPSETTNYIYHVTNGLDCTLQDTVTITISNPQFELGDSETLCPGTEINYNFPEFAGYMTWNDMDETSQYTISEPGQYWAFVENQFGCEFLDSINVSYHPFIDVLGEDEQACPEENLVYNANPILSSYLWSNASILPYIEPLVSGEYTIIATDEFNCIFHDTVYIEIHPTPEISFDGIPLICEFGNTEITAITDAPTVNWSNSVTNNTNIISIPGQYEVLVTSEYGCINTDSIVIEQFFFGDLDLPTDTFFCHGESVTLDPNYNPLATYTHNTDTIYSSIEISQPGNYLIEGNYEICHQTTNVLIADQAIPIIGFGGRNSYCSLGEPLHTELVVFSDNSEDIIHFGDLLVVGPVQVNEEGDYIVTASDSYGCVSETTIPVVEICPPIVYIPNTFTPDHDGINEVFRVTALFIEKYSIVIYNRWGEILYESNDVSKPWNGDVNKGTHYAQNDTYHYIIQVRGTNHNDYKFKGIINII